jgi:site-specific recombinase XerD
MPYGVPCSIKNILNSERSMYDMLKECNLTIPELITATGQAIRKAGYAESTVAKYNKVWRAFAKYVSKRKETHFSSELAVVFLKDKFGETFEYPRTYAQEEYLRSMNRLDEYQKYGIISSKRPLRQKKFVYPAIFDPTVRAYLLARKNENLSNSRIHSLALYLESFSAYLYDIGVKGFPNLRAEHVRRYIDEHVTQYTVSTVCATICCLRGFLAYLHKNGSLESDLSALLPRARHAAEEIIPSAFSRDEVKKILGCIDRCNPKGKRDYAMLLLAARLGMRASDICALELASLKWEENKLEFVQRKTGKPVSLPLLNEVGDAIIEYLMVRPQSNLNSVFLRLAPPHVQLHGHSLYEITRTYMTRSGIHIPPGKKHGPHALRHSLSSILLESRVPLPVISGILAHSSSDTTKVYLKIDHDQLRECALSVPLVVM